MSNFVEIIPLAFGTKLTLKAGCVLIRDGSTNILVDPGQFASRHELDQMLMAKASITISNIDIVYFTHLHFDHYDDLGFSDVPLVLMPRQEVQEVKELMRLRHDVDAYKKRINSSHELLAGIFLRQFVRLMDDQRYDLDNTSFARKLQTVLPGELISSRVKTVDLPGHSIGQIGLEMQTQWGRTLVAADAVLSVEDYLAESFDHHLVIHNLAAMKATRQRLAEYDCVVPGHGTWFCPRTALPLTTKEDKTYA